MKQDDRPLATQTAAPPPVPPRRLIIGVAMADDDDRGPQRPDWHRVLQRGREQIDDARARIAKIQRQVKEWI